MTVEQDPQVCPACWDARGEEVRGLVLETTHLRGAIRRRRVCPACQARWTSYETTVDPRDLRHARPVSAERLR